MGATNSKTENNEALRLCKERRRFIKQAIDSRYALAAAHVSYTQSLRNIGIALRRYAEAEVLIESSISTPDKTPSQFSYPSPSSSHLADVSDSQLHNESSPSPPVATLNYMQSGGTAAMTVRFNPISHSYVDEEFPMPPPPPPPLPESSSSWDYFDPAVDENDSSRFVGNNGVDLDFEEVRGWKQFGDKVVDPSSMENAKFGFDHEGTSKLEMERKNSGTSNKLVIGNDSSVQSKVSNLGGVDDIMETSNTGGNNTHENGIVQNLAGTFKLEECSSKRAEKDVCAEREDPSEYITHRAKDFLSSIKDIEHRFFRASESGKEVSRMLEANKVRVGFSEAKGKSSGWASLTALQLVCGQRKHSLISHDPPPQHGTKVITWKRTISSRSSSSRNPLGNQSKDDAGDSGSDFIEDFCMIAGSHSSTLDRLYAWERKLYDEVKASEPIRKEYDQKCEQLKYMFAKDYSTQVTDKTRAVVKDLHSRIRIALHSVDSIAMRIEKMRDEELHPQLTELTQGLIRMWKAMLECHHAQYITISLAYHSKFSMETSHSHSQGDTLREIMDQLVQEVECFGLSLANWINTHTSYVEALNGWLQSCILQPRERRSRRPFSPRRAIAPPIFVLCRDWSSGIRELPSADLSSAIRTFLSDLQQLMDRQAGLQKRAGDSKSGESKNVDDENGGDSPSNLGSIQSSLTKVLDRLTKFSEALLKMYEDIRQKSEAARIGYSMGRRY